MKLFSKSNEYDKFNKRLIVKQSQSSKPFLRIFTSLAFIFDNPVGRVIKHIFTNKTLFSKVSFTVLIIILFRGLAAIPLPGVDMGVYKEFFGESSASETSLLFSIFTGGQVDTPSIVGLGIASYINASIIFQLLTPVIPKLTELQNEGERGRQIINQYTRYVTLILSIVYSVAFILLVSRRDLNSTSTTEQSANPIYLIPRALGSNWPSIEKIIFMSIVLAAGSILVMWLSELITEKGIGNGSSIIIATGILASLPALIKNDFSSIDFGDIFTKVLDGSFNVLTSPNIISLTAVILGAILVVVSIVFITESVRKLNVQYARRVRADGPTQASHLPLKLTMTGVMPMIFASSLLTMPQILIPILESAFKGSEAAARVVAFLENSFLLSTQDNIVNLNDFVYVLVDFVLIILFGVFYAFIVMKPNETAENLQKQGGFIPGIRPGKQTENYISNVLIRISFAGSIFLALVALIPLVSRNIILDSAGINLFILSGIAGTSILIMVSVIIDTVRQYQSLVATKNYEKYVR